MPVVLNPLELKVKPFLFDKILSGEINNLDLYDTDGVYGTVDVNAVYTHIHLVRGYSPTAPQLVYTVPRQDRKPHKKVFDVSGKPYRTFFLEKQST